MSTGQFPLVAFTGGGGAPPTPSDPTPSDVSDHGSGTDGDGAVGKEGNEGGGCRNGAADRRCLVGNRVLEHSGGGGGGGEGEASSPLSSWGVGVDRGMPWRGLPAPPLSALPWSGPGDEVGVGGTGENISVGSTPGTGWWTARWGVGGGEGGGGTLGVLGALVLVVFGAVVGKRVGRGGGAGENRKKVEERVREGEDIPVSGWPTEIPPRPSTPLPISPLMTTTTTTDTPLSSSPPVARSISDDYVFLDGSPSNTPVPILAPAPHTPRPPIPPTHTPDLDAPDTPTPAPPAEDPDDSDAGAGKRKTPRKKRRGKKKRGAGANGGGADEEGVGGDREKGDEVVGGGLVVVPSTPKVEAPVGSSLVVSDTILGQRASLRNIYVCYVILFFADVTDRLWVPRDGRIQRLPPRPRRRRQTPPAGLRHPRLARSQHPPGVRRPPQRHPILLPRSPRQLPLHRPRALPGFLGRHHREPGPA